jgi:hypothetical protein
VVVAVALVDVVEVVPDQVVDVVAVRHGRVAAVGTVNVTAVVVGARVIGRAAFRVGSVDGNGAFVDVIAVHLMQVPIVEIVDVTGVTNGGVPAAGTVNVIVVWMCRMAHAILLR